MSKSQIKFEKSVLKLDGQRADAASSLAKTDCQMGTGKPVSGLH